MPSTRIKASRRRAQLSCDRCRFIKRKCNRHAPCDRCEQDNASCTFERAHITQAILQQRQRESSSIVSPTQHHESSASSSKATNTSYNDISWMPRLSFDSTTSQGFVCRATHSIPSEISNVVSKVDILQRLSAQPIFLQRLLAVYFREVDWFCDVLSNSRLERLVREHQDPSKYSPSLWDELQELILATIVIVSQTCPTDVEAVILLLDGECRQAFSSAKTLTDAAYQVCCQKISQMAHNSDLKSWSSEMFASSWLLRLYEKNQGTMGLFRENVLVDISRLQRSNLLQRITACHNSSEVSSPTSTIWKAEHDLLAYKVFFAYFFEDRVIAVNSGNGPSFRSGKSMVCLRDSIGHASVEELCKEEDCIMPVPEATCSCCGNSSTLTLSAFSGSMVRIAVLMSRQSDKLRRVRSSTFRWPEDAESLAAHFDLDLLALEADIATLIARDVNTFHPAQEEVIALLIARVRRDSAKLLCDAFAARLINSASLNYTIHPSAVDWLLEKRKLDSARALITRAMEVPGKVSIGLTCKWIFFSKFLHHQAMDLLESTQQWLTREDRYVLELNDLFIASREDYLIECLHFAFMGRNLLALMRRRGELSIIETHSNQVAKACVKVLTAITQGKMQLDHIEDGKIIVDDGLLLHSLKDYLQTTSNGNTNQQSRHLLDQSSPAANNTIFSDNLDGMLSELFADLPAMEQLFFEASPTSWPVVRWTT